MGFLNRSIPCSECLVLPICINKYLRAFNVSMSNSSTKSKIYCSMSGIVYLTTRCDKLEEYTKRETLPLETSPILKAIRFLNKTSGVSKNEKGRLYKKVFGVFNLRKH